MKINESADMVIRTCMGAKDNETVLVVTDTGTDQEIASALYNAAVDTGCETLLLMMEPRGQHGEEPCTIVAEAMCRADVVLAPTSRSLTHTEARRRACDAGARIATMPGITTRMMTTGGLTADHRVIDAAAERLLEALYDTTTVHIMTELGTDLEIDVLNGQWLADTGMCTAPGSFTNLPAGEICIAPHNANGRLVIDGSMAGLGLLDDPLTIDIKDRYATEIKGPRADELKQMIDQAGPGARNIAELGIGINPAASITGSILEDEKVGGTVHVALGDNTSFGGDVSVDLHLDGVVTGPQVHVDGRPLDLDIFVGRKVI